MGFGDQAPLLAAYLYLIPTALVATVVFLYWFMNSRAGELRSLVLGVCMLNFSVSAENIYYAFARITNLFIPFGTSMWVIVPAKLALALSSYLHLHTYATVKYGRPISILDWIYCGLLSLILYPALVMILR
jgi:hypothetical protein